MPDDPAHRAERADLAGSAPGDPASTLKWLRGAAAGRRTHLEELFRRYLPRVRQIVALRLRRPLHACGVEIDDVAQEALVDAYRAFDQFAGTSVGAFRCWLARIVERKIVDLQRRGQAHKRGAGRVRPFRDVLATSAAEHAAGDDGATPSRILAMAEDAGRVEQALLRLRERHRRIIELRDYCGLSHAEISVELALPGETASRALYARAVANLRAALGNGSDPVAGE